MLICLVPSVSLKADTQPICFKEDYHRRISKLWDQRKSTYREMITGSRTKPNHLYDIQTQTNNLLKYAAYSGNHVLLDEMIAMYLKAIETLTETDQYAYYYYPGSPRRSVRQLDRKYRMWVDGQGPVGDESLGASSQFLYLVSEALNIVAGLQHGKRTAVMREAFDKFIPLLIEHYDRWIFHRPGPFQVRGWGCRVNGSYAAESMNHLEFLTKKLGGLLGDGRSPAHCNVVTDTDMWIIAGVANVLVVHKKEGGLGPLTQAQYARYLDYAGLGTKLLQNGFSYTRLKGFDGKPAAGALFERGMWDEHGDYAYAGYDGTEPPFSFSELKLKRPGKGVGWDLSHARRFVHVFDALANASASLGLDFPTRDLSAELANQLIYGTFNRDFRKPLFTNFMDGTNGWYRVGYAGRPGFGYGPWDMSSSVLEGGYGFWSRYNPDVERVFSALCRMLESDEPEIRRHVIEHYETHHWFQHRRHHDIDYKNKENPATQSVLIQFLPSLYFMIGKPGLMHTENTPERFVSSRK
ncbi:MAG: hypothetical protein AB1512_27175 [Thermodesulfobacteriota bacterium]